LTTLDGLAYIDDLGYMHKEVQNTAVTNQCLYDTSTLEDLTAWGQAVA
jgi:hypothetical protein